MVFISHDTRDAKLAEAFSKLLKSVSAGVLKSFRSSDKKGKQGIEFGVEWYPEIIKNIGNASDVVCLLTKRSVNRPWILFEAGMAKGKLDTPILGLVLGVPLKDVSSGPFAQFQNCGDDEDSLTKLVFQLVDRIPGSEPDEETIKHQVCAFKKSIEKILEDNNKSTKAETTEIMARDNSTVKLFEEIKVMFRDLPSKIERNARPVSDRGRRDKNYSHPYDRGRIRMLEEISSMSSQGGYLSVMMMLSIYREHLPWVYEMGMETVKTIRKGKTKAEKKKAFFEFGNIIKLSTRHPVVRELFAGSEDYYLCVEEIPGRLLSKLEMLMMSEEK